MTDKPTREYVRWAAVAVAGGMGLYSLIVLGWTLVQTLSGSGSTGALAFVMIAVLLVSLPMLLIAHGFLTRQYEVAINVSAALTAIFVFCFLMNAERQIHLLRWVDWLEKSQENHPGAWWVFIATFGGFALATTGLLLPIFGARMVSRYCRKLGYRWFGLPAVNPGRHAA